MHAKTLIRQLACQGLARVDIDVEEHDIGFLLCEAPHDRSANSRCASGDENDLAGEVGINGSHGYPSICVGGSATRPDSPAHLSDLPREVHRSEFQLRTSKIEGRIASKNKSPWEECDETARETGTSRCRMPVRSETRCGRNDGQVAAHRGQPGPGQNLGGGCARL